MRMHTVCQAGGPGTEREEKLIGRYRVELIPPTMDNLRRDMAGTAITITKTERSWMVTIHNGNYRTSATFHSDEKPTVKREDWTK